MLVILFHYRLNPCHSLFLQRQNVFEFYVDTSYIIINAANKNERVVDVKNLDSQEVALQAMRLRNSTGRKVVKLKTRHVTFRPSVQGTWTPDIKF